MVLQDIQRLRINRSLVLRIQCPRNLESIYEYSHRSVCRPTGPPVSKLIAHQGLRCAPPPVKLRAGSLAIDIPSRRDSVWMSTSDKIIWAGEALVTLREGNEVAEVHGSIEISFFKDEGRAGRSNLR